MSRSQTNTLGNRVVLATATAITEAVRLIRCGGLVAFPTETVYGLGADAGNSQAIANLFLVKGRPLSNPLIVHVDSIDFASALVELDTRGMALASRFWPGPLTLVARRRPSCLVSPLLGAGLDTLAVRVPAHPIALALLNKVGCPIAAPSANPSGRLSPTTAAHVASLLSDTVDLILDGGPCQVGLESTVVSLSSSHATLLRPGGITTEAITDLIGPLIAVDKNALCLSPGMPAHHYAPNRPLRLNAYDIYPGEVLLGFGQVPRATLNLSPLANLKEAATNLFAMLRRLDQSSIAAIAVSPIPASGLGAAINDRLRRAASSY